MAVRKTTRSNPPAQPRPQHAKTARAGDPAQPQPARRPDHQLKAEIFEALRHLNRGYGVALAALDKLDVKDRQQGPRAFRAGFLHDYRNRAEALRSETNRDLLRLLAGREDHDAERFAHLCAQSAKASPAPNRNRQP
jgi:hypothetical protein